MFEYFERCPVCDRPLVNEANIIKLRKLMLGSGVVGLLLGGASLPLLGFGVNGITVGSFAAYIQSLIGNVAAGSLFATFQSLGTTGMGILLFGSIGAAIGVLAPYAANLGWCNGCNNKKE